MPQHESELSLVDKHEGGAEPAVPETGEIDSAAPEAATVPSGATQDGEVGPGTAKLANAMNEFDLCRLLCDRREKFYRDIVAANPSQARFINGWLRRINEMRDFTRGPLV